MAVTALLSAMYTNGGGGEFTASLDHSRGEFTASPRPFEGRVYSEFRPFEGESLQQALDHSRRRVYSKP